MELQKISTKYAELRLQIEAMTETAGEKDKTTIWRFLEKIIALENLHYGVTNFRFLLEDVEDEESRSLIQKHFHILMTTVYIDYLNDIIDAAETWKVVGSDMRALQVTIHNTLVPIRDFYQEQFNF